MSLSAVLLLLFFVCCFSQNMRVPLWFSGRKKLYYNLEKHTFPTDPGYKWLNATFSTGGFKAPTAKTSQCESKPVSLKDGDSAQLSTTEDFSCPQEGCVCVFQQLSSLERHLSFEKCSKALERQPLLDIAKTQYASYLMEGAGVMPMLKSREHVVTSETSLNIKEG